MLMRNLLDRTFAHPTGILGRLGGVLMSRSESGRNDWTLSLLDLTPHACILEVGFGPGTLIEALGAAIPAGSISGIDASPVMLRQASARNQEAIRDRRVHLRVGSATILPYEDASFDVVLSANSIFFWPDQPAGVREIHRVLKPGGQIALILQPRWAKSVEDVKSTGTEYMTMLSTQGYQQVRSVLQPMRPVASVAVLGVRNHETAIVT
jgi:ubiquinone/menaquinone biosynthesis C-methylase UbiE